MNGGGLAFDFSELDAIVADDEDICRAAAVRALLGSCLQVHRVHEVESGDQALAVVHRLQHSEARVRRVPVIVFIDVHMAGGLATARELCAFYAQGPLSREPFLVCSSARRLQSSDASCFHCSVPKTFEPARVNSVLEACERWQRQGGGEPGLRPVQLSSASLNSLPSMGHMPSMSSFPSMGALPSMGTLPEMSPVGGSDSGSSGGGTPPRGGHRYPSGRGTGGYLAKSHGPMPGFIATGVRPGFIATGVRPVGMAGRGMPQSAVPVPAQPCRPPGWAASGVRPVLPVQPVQPIQTFGGARERNGAASPMVPAPSAQLLQNRHMVAPPRTTAPLPERGVGGNTMDSLDLMLPPRPPFEDVEMVGLVGRGSFGRVYEARWGISPVALKVVDHHDNENAAPDTVSFEGALSASLAHPNLVQTFKYSVREVAFSPQARPRSEAYEVWIVQEWCGMGTLAQRLSKKAQQEMMGGSIEEVVEVASEIACAASYLHSRGIIHGDLTPSNVLLLERPSSSKGYTAKVSDFGLARVLDTGMSSINTATMGTVTYMPPELFQLEGCRLTQKVDVYAFGIIFWQLCSGETPFAGLQPTQIVVMVAQGSALDMPYSVPSPLREVFVRSTERNPDNRPGFDLLCMDLKKLYEACQAGFFEDC